MAYGTISSGLHTQTDSGPSPSLTVEPVFPVVSCVFAPSGVWSCHICPLMTITALGCAASTPDLILSGPTFVRFGRVSWPVHWATLNPGVRGVGVQALGLWDFRVKLRVYASRFRKFPRP